MKKKKLLIGTVAGLVAIVLTYFASSSHKGFGSFSFNPYGNSKLTDDEKLGNFTFLMMDVVNADLSTLRRQILARTLVRVTGEIFAEYRHREAFIGIVAQESKFAAAVKSPAGAVGISQILPQYAGDFARLCGLSDFKSQDLMDVELNMYLGACFYRDLLEKLGGNTTSAQVAYNGGLYGAGLKALLSQKNIANQENSNYPVQISYKKEEAKLALEKVENSVLEDSKDKTLQALITINDARVTLSTKSKLRVKFTLKNKEEAPAVGSTAVMATYESKDGVQTFVVHPPLLDSADAPAELSSSPSLSALHKRALPFSIKKLKEYEFELTAPLKGNGSFKDIKVVVFDSRNNGITLVPANP